MTNDLNDHEQAHTYGVHLHVTLRGSFVSVSAMLVDTRQKKYRSSFYS